MYDIWNREDTLFLEKPQTMF